MPRVIVTSPLQKSRKKVKGPSMPTINPGGRPFKGRIKGMPFVNRYLKQPPLMDTIQGKSRGRVQKGGRWTEQYDKFCFVKKKKDGTSKVVCVPKWKTYDEQYSRRRRDERRARVAATVDDVAAGRFRRRWGEAGRPPRIRRRRKRRPASPAAPSPAASQNASPASQNASPAASNTPPQVWASTPRPRGIRLRLRKKKGTEETSARRLSFTPKKRKSSTPSSQSPSPPKRRRISTPSSLSTTPMPSPSTPTPKRRTPTPKSITPVPSPLSPLHSTPPGRRTPARKSPSPQLLGFQPLTSPRPQRRRKKTSPQLSALLSKMKIGTPKKKKSPSRPFGGSQRRKSSRTRKKPARYQ